MLSLMWQSLKFRRTNAMLSLLVICIAVALFIGVELVRKQTRESFANTISGTDLIVGARSGSLNLLLYSVFRLGDATNNMDWRTYEKIAAINGVKWNIPIALGDSHKGYRVLGTTTDYFEHYQFGQQQHLKFASGAEFKDLFDVVVGAEVAQSLGYQVGDRLTLAHGTAKVAIQEHDDLPFVISGILAPTGTPVDSSLHVSLQAIEAIHKGWANGSKRSDVTPEQVQAMDLQPKTLTAVFLGLDSKLKLLRVQRAVNTYKKEALSAIIPGVALQQLWNMLSRVESALLLVSGFVVAVGLTGMLTTLLASLNERRREIAVLRAVGARPAHIFILLLSESLLICIVGTLAGYALATLSIALLAPWVQSEFGLLLQLGLPSAQLWWMLAGILIAGFIAGCIPAWRAYRQTLHDGLSPRS